MERDSSLSHTKHVFRVFLLLAVILVAGVLGRSAFLPDSWGEFGWFRGDAVAEHRARTQIHGGDASCTTCHEEQSKTHSSNSHKTVRCEVCHAPVAGHAADGKKTADMPISKTAKLCMRCHRFLVARPKSFPQVRPREHVETNGGEFTEAACFECHEPHSPN